MGVMSETKQVADVITFSPGDLKAPAINGLEALLFHCLYLRSELSGRYDVNYYLHPC